MKASARRSGNRNLQPGMRGTRLVPPRSRKPAVPASRSSDHVRGKKRSRFGTDSTHWRTGNRGRTWSARWAAASTIRRVLQAGQTLYAYSYWRNALWLRDADPGAHNSQSRSRLGSRGPCQIRRLGVRTARAVHPAAAITSCGPSRPTAGARACSPVLAAPDSRRHRAPAGRRSSVASRRSVRP